MVLTVLSIRKKQGKRCIWPRTANGPTSVYLSRKPSDISAGFLPLDETMLVLDASRARGLTYYANLVKNTVYFKPPRH